MSNEIPPIYPPRDQVVPLLIKQFVLDYHEGTKGYEFPVKLELTEHLLVSVGLMLLYAQRNNEAVYEHYVELEDELLRKYRKALKPYFVKQFFKYFWFDEVLLEKKIYTKEEFNRIAPDWRRLTLTEITEFVSRCQDILFHLRAVIYLQMEPEAGVMPKEATPSLPEPQELDKEFSKPRRLLAIYYLLKAGYDIDHRENKSISAIARFAHLLTGTKITSIQNSDIYKKYSMMPNFNKGEKLIADLRFIRPFFEDLHIETALQLIDAEIKRAIEDVPAGKRKKYRGSGDS